MWIEKAATGQIAETDPIALRIFGTGLDPLDPLDLELDVDFRSNHELRTTELAIHGIGASPRHEEMRKTGGLWRSRLPGSLAAAARAAVERPWRVSDLPIQFGLRNLRADVHHVGARPLRSTRMMRSERVVMLEPRLSHRNDVVFFFCCCTCLVRFWMYPKSGHLQSGAHGL